jgi:hypothetical protein
VENIAVQGDTYAMVGMIRAEANIISAQEQPIQPVKQIQDGTLQVHAILLTNVQEAEQERRHGLQGRVLPTVATQILGQTYVPVVQITPVRLPVQGL